MLFVVGQCAAVLQLLPREDQALLVRRDALLVLDLRLHVLDGVGRLHIKRDGLARQRPHEDRIMLLCSQVPVLVS